MRFALILILALGVWAAGAGAQETYLSGSGLGMSGRPSGSLGPNASASSSGGLFGNLLKSNRFHINNETSFSVVSGAGGSLSQGLNITRLSFDARSNLSLTAGVGSLFMSGGSYNGYSAKPGIFLHDLSLNYHPSEHSLIRFQFQQAPGGRANPYYFGSGYGFDDFSSFGR
jgi:hypothetical protein